MQFETPVTLAQELTTQEVASYSATLLKQLRVLARRSGPELSILTHLLDLAVVEAVSRSKGDAPAPPD